MARHRRVAAFVVLGLAGLAAAAPPEQPQKPRQAYALIKGTAYGPDHAPFYGARVQVRPAGKKHPSWELLSDHRGEFAQRVPPGPGDYVITGEAELRDPQTHKIKRLKGATKVHVEADEEQNPSLHLSE